MEEKIVTIPFNYHEFIASQKVIWSFSLKKVIKSYIIYTIIPIVILVLDLKTDSKDIFGIIIGSALLFYMILKWSNIFERRFKFFKRAKTAAKRFEEGLIECTFTFSENEMEYRDKEKLYKLNWSLFNPYLIFKDTIILTAKDTEGVLFTISKNDVGIENYQEICAILEDRIGENN